MKVLSSYRVLRFTLVLTAILAQCVALSSFSLLVIAGTLAALSWYITEGPRGKSIPGWVSRLLVLVVFLFSIVDAIGPFASIPLVLGRFVVWLTVIKLYGKRTTENEGQLLLLSLLLLAVGALYARDMLFGVLLVGWSGLAAWVMLLYQLHHGMVTMREERYEAVPIEYPTPWTRPVTGLHVRRTFRRTALFFLLLGFVGSTGFFMLIPRESSEEDATQSVARDDTLERMELTPDQDIQLSNRRVMTVSLRDQASNTVRLPRGLRLRGAALSEYQGFGVWETGRHYKSTVETQNDEFTSLAMPQQRTDSLYMDVTLFQPLNKVYSLYKPVGIETSPPSRVSMNLANSTMGLALGSTPLQRYTIEIQLEEIIVSPYATKQHHYQNNQVHALALEILKNASVDVEDVSISSGTARRAAVAFEKYLHGKEFVYSINSSNALPWLRDAMLESEDPIALFLLQLKRGHCEFFAAAMVAMCDTVQLPARIVTGYYADRFDTAQNEYVVLERDAHAWVEVETAPLAWETFDPTPSSGESPIVQKPMTLAQNMRVRWEQWEGLWQQYILGYDFKMQKSLVEHADPFWRRHLHVVTDFFTSSANRIIRWFDIGAGGRLWINLVVGACVLSGFTVLFLRFRHTRVTKLLQLSKSSEGHVPISSVEFYARLQRVFLRHGFERPQHMPAMTWVETLNLPIECSDIAISLSSTYYMIRFGNYRPDRRDKLQLLQKVQHLDSKLMKETQ